LAASPSVSSDTLQLVTHIVGTETPVISGIRRDSPPALIEPIVPTQPSIEQALDRHPFLALSERTGYLELREGDWDVTGDLILPNKIGLLAVQPVTLRFDPGAIVFANAPLLLHGSEDGAISFVPRKGDWGGVIVLRAGDDVVSSLSYVTIRGVMGVQRDGWSISGGVTFFESPVMLAHCRLVNGFSRNALHIIRTHFECANTEFGYVSSHALRSDFAKGRVEGCRFHDVLGHALDISNSQIGMHDASFLRVYDHGIAAREHSVVTLQGGRAEDVSLVVSSSDMSHVHVQDVRIVQAWKAGLAAFTGKMGYGPASIQASDVLFEDKGAIEALAQQGSSVRLDGSVADGKVFEVEELAWRESISSTIRALSYRLGSTTWLVGYGLVPSELSPVHALQVTLYWHARATIDRDYTVFVHVLDASGQFVTGQDAMPRQNTFPTTAWPTGRVIDDQHVIPLPADISPGEYRVVVGMYYLPTGERLPVKDATGERILNDVILLDQGFSVLSD
jgi:hypothetical protein